MRQARSHTRSGQSLVEALIAISLLLVGFLGTITLINRSIGLTRVVADSYVGTYLAAEGIEVTKSLIDSNYIAGRPYYEGFQACASTCDWELDADTTWERRPTPFVSPGRTLWYDPNVRSYSYLQTGIETTYRRKVSVTLTGPNAKEIVVISRVEWRARGGGDSSVTLEDHFYDWGGAGTASTSSTSTAE